MWNWVISAPAKGPVLGQRKGNLLGRRLQVSKEGLMNAQDCERYCKSAMSVLIVDMRALKEQVNVLWEPLNKSLRLFCILWPPSPGIGRGCSAQHHRCNRRYLPF